MSRDDGGARSGPKLLGAASWPAQLAPFFATQATGTVPLAQLQASEQNSARWSGARVHELLTFYVAHQLHGLSIRDVTEVAKLPPLTRVPRMQAGLLGVTSRRGNLVPVVDAAHFFEPAPAALSGPEGAPAPTAARTPSHLIILGDEAAPLGLAVGRIVGVSRLPSEAVVPHLGSAREARVDGGGCIAGFATTPQGGTVMVLHAESLAQRFAVL